MKNTLKIIAIIISALLIICISFFIIRYIRIKNIRDSVVITDTIFDNTDFPAEINEDDTIGKLTIPSILLQKAPVKEGVELDILAEAIGHFPSTNILGGNIGLASHNGGDKSPYFKKLNKLKRGDDIYFESIYGTFKYTVETITIIDETDFSYLQQTEDNRLTLITCVRNQPEKRLCVQAIQSK